MARPSDGQSRTLLVGIDGSPIMGGNDLRIIREAREFVLTLGRKRNRLHEHWHHVYDLIMAASVETVTHQLQHALFNDGLLDLKAVVRSVGDNHLIADIATGTRRARSGQCAVRGGGNDGGFVDYSFQLGTAVRVELVLISLVVLAFLALAGAVWLVWVPAGR
jgi:hypothetical protein